MFSALTVAARFAGRRKALCGAASLLMWGEIFDTKLQELGKEADKQALTLSSRSLDLCYTPTYDASLGKSVCSALAQ